MKLFPGDGLTSSLRFRKIIQIRYPLSTAGVIPVGTALLPPLIAPRAALPQ
jgi:hypothetical protein